MARMKAEDAEQQENGVQTNAADTFGAQDVEGNPEGTPREQLVAFHDWLFEQLVEGIHWGPITMDLRKGGGDGSKRKGFKTKPMLLQAGIEQIPYLCGARMESTVTEHVVMDGGGRQITIYLSATEIRTPDEPPPGVPIPRALCGRTTVLLGAGDSSQDGAHNNAIQKSQKRSAGGACKRAFLLSERLDLEPEEGRARPYSAQPSDEPGVQREYNTLPQDWQPKSDKSRALVSAAQELVAELAKRGEMSSWDEMQPAERRDFVSFLCHKHGWQPDDGGLVSCINRKSNFDPDQASDRLVGGTTERILGAVAEIRAGALQEHPDENLPF